MWQRLKYAFRTRYRIVALHKGKDFQAQAWCVMLPVWIPCYLDKPPVDTFEEAEADLERYRKG